MMALKTAVLSSLLFAATPIRLVAQTATIHLRVLDGRTGKNLSGMNPVFVDYHSGRDLSTHADDLHGRVPVKTSADGDSYVANPDPHGVLVFAGLGSGTWTTCTGQKFYGSDTRTYGSEHLYWVSTIVVSGLVAKNNCSKRTATAKPGELVIFVRPATWWEKFVAGMRS
jgi:hypothetical protein